LFLAMPTKFGPLHNRFKIERINLTSYLGQTSQN
jgi:hypothetical protein